MKLHLQRKSVMYTTFNAQNEGQNKKIKIWKLVPNRNLGTAPKLENPMVIKRVKRVTTPLRSCKNTYFPGYDWKKSTFATKQKTIFLSLCKTPTSYSKELTDIMKLYQ